MFMLLSAVGIVCLKGNIKCYVFICQISTKSAWKTELYEKQIVFKQSETKILADQKIF